MLDLRPKFRWQVILACFAPPACGSSNDTTLGGASDAASSGSIVIGPAGGQVTAGAVELDVPAGALTTPIRISVAPSSSAPPAGYVMVSSLVQFSPAGTTFLVPATVHFQTTEALVGAKRSLVGRCRLVDDPLPTTWEGSSASALVVHFSNGFVGAPGSAADAAAAATDATDATAPADATTPADAATNAGADGGLGATPDGAGTGTGADAASIDASDVDATPPAALSNPFTSPIDATVTWPASAPSTLTSISAELWESDDFCNVPSGGCTPSGPGNYEIVASTSVDPHRGRSVYARCAALRFLGDGGATVAARYFEVRYAYVYNATPVVVTGTCTPAFFLDATPTATTIACSF